MSNPFGDLDPRVITMLEEIEVLNPYAVKVRHKLYLADSLFYQFQANQSPILPLLSQTLYGEYYCAMPDGSTDQSHQNAEHSDELNKEFLQKLRVANQGQEQVSSAWNLHSQETGGQTVMFCGETVHIAQPQDLIPLQDEDATKTVGYHLRLPVEQISEETGFYFAKGETPVDAFDGNLITRFYFNIGAEGVETWLSLITREFNRRLLPFTLKCPLYPFAYRRTDPCVCYIPRRYLPMVIRVVRNLAHDLQPLLRGGTPLFSLEIAPGIGMADDPGSGESFGQHRMRLVAQALCEASVNDASNSLERKVQSVEDVFSQHGLSIRSPHLSPDMWDFANALTT